MYLNIELAKERMPVAVAFVESAARAALLGNNEAAMLALGTEELFMALCSSMPGSGISMIVNDRRYAVEILFRIPLPPPDLRIFNLTSTPDHDTEEGLSDMGLYLASRVCDQFSIRSNSQQGNWEIMLRKDRSYPVLQHEHKQLSADYRISEWSLTRNPEPELVRQLSILISEKYSEIQFPEEFTPPGRLLDKLASDDYGIVLAQDEKGRLAGGLVWRITEGRVASCFGPYLADVADPDQLIVALCEKVAEKFGRSDRLGLVLHAPEQPPAMAGFETTGSLVTPGGEIWIGYRMLAEEFGADALVHSELIPFYSDLCCSMALTRNISPYHNHGEGGDGLTLFSTLLNRGSGMAILTPLLAGRDAENVVKEHVQILDRDGFSSVYCSLDTGRPFDAMLASGLLENGFVPGILIPWGGVGDLISMYRARGA